jgi:hypothetical protein
VPGLIKKDVLLLKKTVSWQYLLPIVIFAVSCFHNPSLLAMLLAIGVFFIMNTLAVSTLTLDFQYKWEVTVRSLPLDPKQVIGSKYLFVLLMTIGSLIAVAAIEVVLSMTLGVSWETGFLAVTVALSSTLLYSAVLLPVLYRYGLVKLQAAILAYTALMFLVMMLIDPQRFADVSLQLFSNVGPLSLGISVASLAVFGASFFLSVKASEAAFRLW